MTTARLRILTYTNLFPNFVRPNAGIFIKNRMLAYVNQTNSHLDVIAPVPYYPKLPWQTRWSHFSQVSAKEIQHEIRVFHPKYLVVPKVGMNIHGQSMYWSTKRLARCLHQDNKYDLLDAHWIYPDGWAAVKIARKLGLPVVLSARGNDINEYIDFPKIRPLIKWSLNNCNHIISVCQALKDLMVSLGIADSKITVIKNGVDIDKFYFTPMKKARKELDLPLDGQILLSVGILEPRKGHHILINALHILRQKGIKLPHLYIIGSGPFYNELKKLIENLGLQNNVTLVGSILHHRLQVWYNAAEILCLASDREGWPNVLLEAIGCGTPVVASRVFGTPEVITSKDVGLLVDSRTPAAFSEKIHLALRHHWDSKKLVEFAKQHTWDKTGQAVQEVFLRVLNRYQRVF